MPEPVEGSRPYLAGTRRHPGDRRSRRHRLSRRCSAGPPEACLASASSSCSPAISSRTCSSPSIANVDKSISGNSGCAGRGGCFRRSSSCCSSSSAGRRCSTVRSSASLRDDLPSAVAYYSNWWFIHQHVSYFARFGPPTPLGHLWSLAIEEQFYLLWPLLLLIGLRFTLAEGR